MTVSGKLRFDNSYISTEGNKYLLSECRHKKTVTALGICEHPSGKSRNPCDLYPLTPRFYIAKLGFTGVYIIFALKHRLWVLARTATETVLTCTHNQCFEQK